MRIELKVEGMTCGGCEKGVEGALQELYPGSKIKASHTGNTVSFESDEKVSVKQVIDTIRNKGYNVISWENSVN
ncbi:MAG: heavy-metal-associated domain-containing protein [Flavobacteriales bacterium]|nr:heavy-metal-associated domain-containing protein [Flavobacteriales bacterium]